MKYKKFRELEFVPKKIKFKNIKINKIKNYMPAGNDVVECEIEYLDNKVDAFLKIERSKMADFVSEVKNINLLRDNNYYDKIPYIYEDGLINDKHYIVLSKFKGKRLSDILKKNNKDKNDYLIKYGRELGLIHKISPKEFDVAKQRIINFEPKSDNYNLDDSKIKEYLEYLYKNKIEMNYNTFIHGDFHYGNIIWNNKKIEGVIDYEYSGIGLKEQDIAWAITLRPGQLFMDNINDIRCFLEGYKEVNTFSSEHLKWCLINCYLHFYLMNNDIKYRNKILKLLKSVDSLF